MKKGYGMKQFNMLDYNLFLKFPNAFDYKVKLLKNNIFILI